MRRFLKRLRVRYATEAEMRPLDPELRSLLNVNAPADLEQARRWLEA
jgi:molybdopterin-guanine dinucleotide biosynthesis protein A